VSLGRRTQGNHLTRYLDSPFVCRQNTLRVSLSGGQISRRGHRNTLCKRYTLDGGRNLSLHQFLDLGPGP
jgi:hypothetical protein